MTQGKEAKLDIIEAYYAAKQFHHLKKACAKNRDDVTCHRQGKNVERSEAQ